MTKATNAKTIKKGRQELQKKMGENNESKCL